MSTALAEKIILLETKKKVVKRDGRVVPFDRDKIKLAVEKALAAAGGHVSSFMANRVASDVEMVLAEINKPSFEVEFVQDEVERALIKNNLATAAKLFILYRSERTKAREGRSELMDIVSEILKETSRENANISNSPSAKMLQIGSAASRAYYLNRKIPKHFSDAHRNGDLHIHDLDYYGKTLTCLQIPLGKLLKDGFNTGHGFIRPPRRPGSATALAAIILQSNQNDMHGGQSFAFFDRDMAPYFEGYPDKECFQACEALIYNLNSMHSRAGAQVPFSSLNLGTDTTEGGRSLIKNILLAYEKGLGHGENPIFPNIIFKVKKGVNFDPGDPNYDLFQLAIRVASKRLNPTFSFLDSTFNAPFGDETSYMGCRTRTLANCNGPEVSDGRGNLSFTTINLPRIGIKAKKNMKDFYALLQESLSLATQQLLHRYETQATLKVRDMPFLMGQHLYLDSENLKANDEIREAIKHGTLSVGFIGLAECLTALRGEHHGESEEAQKVGIEIVRYMREYMDEMTEKYDLNFTLLGTPAEGLSGRFLRIDRKEFGEIPGVTDKEYYTNSSHVPVGYKISAFKKIEVEAPYQEFENAGHISYIELTGSPQFNLSAIETLLRAMADANMGYCGINFPIDFCNDCNFFGIINDVNCECGSDDISRVRRITGYLSTVERFNDSKKAELDDRTDHVLLRGE